MYNLYVQFGRVGNSRFLVVNNEFVSNLICVCVIPLDAQQPAVPFRSYGVYLYLRYRKRIHNDFTAVL